MSLDLGTRQRAEESGRVLVTWAPETRVVVKAVVLCWLCECGLGVNPRECLLLGRCGTGMDGHSWSAEGLGQACGALPGPRMSPTGPRGGQKEEKKGRRERKELGIGRASGRPRGHTCHLEDRNEAISAGAGEDQMASALCPGLALPEFLPPKYKYRHDPE